MAGGSSFGAPASASILFRREPEWPSDHVYYIEELSKNGVSPAELKQVDLQGKPGWCLVALSCGAARDRLVSSGLSISGKAVPVTVGGSEVITVSVFGCPLHLHDGAVASSLGAFGDIHGPITRKIVEHGDFSIETGTRHARMSLKKSMPSTVRIGSGSTTVRVWYPGQMQTCFRCQQGGHEAKACPNRLTHTRSTTNPWGRGPPANRQLASGVGSDKEDSSAVGGSDAERVAGREAGNPSSLDQQPPSATTANRQLASASGVGSDKPYSDSSATGGSDAERDASREPESASVGRTEGEPDFTLALSPDSSWAEESDGGTPTPSPPQPDPTTSLAHSDPASDEDRAMALLADCAKSNSKAGTNSKRQRSSTSPSAETEFTEVRGRKKKRKGPAGSKQNTWRF